MNDYMVLKRMIDEAHNIVFFGGAGTSTESGIKDYRSKDGLYSMKLLYPPEYMLSHEMFMLHPKEFYDFYRLAFNCLSAKPNVLHHFLLSLEECGKLKGIITQNVDGLHQKAGSKNVLELHGSIYDNYCEKCGKYYEGDLIFKNTDIPKCVCGGIIKPSVVLYGEALDANVLDEAVKLISDCDLLIVAGSSLTVEPSCSLVLLCKGKLVILNKSKTTFDSMANLVIHDSLGNIVRGLKCEN